jgi:hypothetical protein
MSNIVASKKCDLCGAKILIVNEKVNRPDDPAFKRTVNINKELPHNCDGGESKFIEAHEISDKEYFERYAPDVNQWEGWDYLQR